MTGPYNYSFPHAILLFVASYWAILLVIGFSALQSSIRPAEAGVILHVSKCFYFNFFIFCSDIPYYDTTNFKNGDITTLCSWFCVFMLWTMIGSNLSLGYPGLNTNELKNDLWPYTDYLELSRQLWLPAQFWWWR